MYSKLPCPRFDSKVLILLFALFCFPVFSPAQSWEKEILKKSSLYQAIHRQEKIFVQTDRPVYVAGEQIWFSAFILDASTQRLNLSERVLYVELVNREGMTCQKQIHKIERGRTWGSMEINPTLPEGNYHFVAYTNWLRNLGSEFYFRKGISINNPNEQDESSEPAATTFSPVQQPDPDEPEPSLQSELTMSFFPEGGDLIEGVVCKVAFEITNPYNQGMDVTGIVRDDQDNFVYSLKTLWDGKGFF